MIKTIMLCTSSNNKEYTAYPPADAHPAMDNHPFLDGETHGFPTQNVMNFVEFPFPV